MSELISGKEALIALANGEKLQAMDAHGWKDINMNTTLALFDMPMILFRLKPRTITINGIEVPAPFKPKDGELFYCFSATGVSQFNTNESFKYMGAWKTRGEVEQVVAALRSIFNEGS